MVDACRELGIRRLVYTSTIDVVVDGRRPIVDGDESLPYPGEDARRPLLPHKDRGRTMMIAANGPDLATCALRPAGMYGPRDRYHLGNIVDMARRGRYMRAGSGKARFTHVYSENAAHVHLLAARAPVPWLSGGRPDLLRGRPLPGHQPVRLHGALPGSLGLPAPQRSIPYPVAYVAACVAELVAPRSNLTRFSVVQTCIDHTYRHDKAERDLGYKPIVSLR